MWKEVEDQSKPPKGGMTRVTRVTRLGPGRPICDALGGGSPGKSELPSQLSCSGLDMDKGDKANTMPNALD